MALTKHKENYLDESILCTCCEKGKKEPPHLNIMPGTIQVTQNNKMTGYQTGNWYMDT